MHIVTFCLGLLVKRKFWTLRGHIAYFSQIPIMENVQENRLTDDEEDLEALRLAALQSLKKKNDATNGSLEPAFHSSRREDQVLRQGKSHKGFTNNRRYFGGRGPKNGHYQGNNTRVRQNNLISIRTVVEDQTVKDLDNNSTLSLPQDRYTGGKEKSNKTDESSSKFDRYNDTDKSDEESEEENAKSGSDNDGSTPKLERNDSLEAIMQELEDEITGKSKNKDKEVKQEKDKQKSKKGNDLPVVENVVSDVKPTPELCPPEKTVEAPKEPVLEPVIGVANRKESPEKSEPPPLRKRRKVFPNRREFQGYRRPRRTPPYPEPPFIPNIPPVPFPPMFNPHFRPPNVAVPPPPVPFYERPLSPLSINADTLQAQTRAPLSPRSAAFVLENRAIIEKRKRSPRRSYSRSPSPRRRSPSPLRRSISPRRRSRSPRRRSKSPRRRSLSPKVRQFSPKARAFSPRPRGLLSPPHSPKLRLGSPKQRQGSPKQRQGSPKLRPVSPRRRSMSPKRRDKKESDQSSKQKPSIRDRLGLKNPPKSDNKESAEKPEPSKVQKEEKVLDPVLEARKKKFESKEIKVKEGVIRLKPKDEAKPEKNEEIANEEIKKEDTEKVTSSEVSEKEDDIVKDLEALLKEDILLVDDALELDHKTDLLFSDEESGSENEGRFKVKQPNLKKPAAALPFTKLVNGEKEKPATVKRRRLSDRPSSRASPAAQRKIKLVSPERTKDSKRSRTSRSSSVRNLSVKKERHPVERRFERKIEIKIKNPSKYEKEDKSRHEKRQEEKKEKKVERKVEVENQLKIDEDDDDDFETEIIIEHDEDEVENNVKDDDLRTQLSKKRAEKLSKHTKGEAVPSRLLQSALQNALPLKKSKKPKSQELSSSEAKLPIHLRLGTCGLETFSKPKRKSRKRKNGETEGQV